MRRRHISGRFCWLILCLTCLGGQVPVSAEVYQWRDEQGKLHFSDKKPRRYQAEAISQRLGTVNVDESRSEQQKLQRLFKPETAAEKAHQQRKHQQQNQQLAQHQQQCQRARRYLQTLRGSVYFEREDGSTYDIPEAERQQKVAELEAQLRQHCP